jgi:hypothetical protein
MRLSISLFAALALACSLAQAQAYRWVDKDGKVRYSDVPPAGVKATPLKPPPTPPAPPPSAASKDPAAKDAKADNKDARKGQASAAEQEQAYRERQAKAKEARDKEDNERVAAEQRKQNCASAQEGLRTLEAGRRITTTNAQGETVFLDEAQVRERVAQARQVVAENCK